MPAPDLPCHLPPQPHQGSVYTLTRDGHRWEDAPFPTARIEVQSQSGSDLVQAHAKGQVLFVGKHQQRDALQLFFTEHFT
eukprot:CAMPEP_0174296250 /NCGR_PEP_ID=MMETSP0809-20121228/47277_1 /TAXON_ID=73025 ORGANISM="Eutreptiella gymnastica-like, Strain CCMP1594" /NCGR_SAMPLE_ID=MMETSP0809 /ASSEMBLY_ACC=CAM_ASM_000658 /LENGTH=79 /DNA_ID=CAMNT_0015399103 /DNA_START=1697 /DNA_END=1936 /DNA_ORIENTATION=+